MSFASEDVGFFSPASSAAFMVRYRASKGPKQINQTRRLVETVLDQLTLQSSIVVPDLVRDGFDSFP
jgi:hypothetical protein